MYDLYDLFIDIIQGSLVLLRTDIVVKQQARVSFSVRRFYYSSFELLPENFVLL